MGSVFSILALLTCTAMAILWAYQWHKQDATIVDVGWAFGLLFTSGLFMMLIPGSHVRQLLVCLLAAIWAGRLGVYLFVNRVVQHDQEDGRYKRMRAAMGKWAQLGFFAFFQAQAGFVLIFALPIYAAAANDQTPLSWLDALGILIGVIAIIGETIADRQLAAFRSDPTTRGTTCRRGLWKYSRHPNYFFEILHWFAYPCLAAGSELWWVGALGPVIVISFIWKITGVPHTETQALSNRPDYADYQRTTSMFIPWPPKS